MKKNKEKQNEIVSRTLILCSMETFKEINLKICSNMKSKAYQQFNAIAIAMIWLRIRY